MSATDSVKEFISIDDIKIMLFVRNESPSEYEESDIELFYPQLYAELEITNCFFCVDTITRTISKVTTAPEKNQIYFVFESDAQAFSLRKETCLSDFTSKFFDIDDEFVSNAININDIKTILRYRKLPYSEQGVLSFLQATKHSFHSTQENWYYVFDNSVMEAPFDTTPKPTVSYFPTKEVAQELIDARLNILYKPISKGMFYTLPDFSSTVFVWNELVLGDYDVVQFFNIDGEQKVFQKRDFNWNYDIVSEDEFAEKLFISYKKTLGDNFQTIYNFSLIDNLRP